MRDKIIFFCIGAIVVILSVYIGNLVAKESQSTTTTTEADKTATFDTVIVKGKLFIGNEDNFILLESDKDKSNIIIDSKGSNIIISTDSKSSAIMLSKQLDEFTNIGAVLTQQQRQQGNLITHFKLKDSYGENVIRSTD